MRYTVLSSQRKMAALWQCAGAAGYVYSQGDTREEAWRTSVKL